VDLSLERIKKLLKKLNNPQRKIKNIIHIAGTNGKGSIATILYYLQKNQGKTVNIYTSPHLISFNERIHIKNKQVSNKYLLEVLEYIKEVNDKQPITFFEIITAATFYMFYQNLADCTILEVGLGGQFDATNVIENNLVSIISTIGIDHKEFLGSNIKSIANEKVGIIKKKSCVISSKQTLSAKRIIKKKSEEMKSSLYQYNENWKVKNNVFYCDDLQINLEKISLIGQHQHINVSCALMACIKEKKLNINIKSLYKIFPKMYWPGRLEKISTNLIPNYSNIECWVDVAHNKLGFTVLLEWINQIKMKNFYIILALGIRKDYINILKVIKKANPKILFVLQGKSFNSHEPKKIKAVADQLKISSIISENIYDALNIIKKDKNTCDKKKVVITGSIGLVGSFLAEIK
tara:strand:+ start:1391 stop:2608 length:1218 start_codon:yes stop_codon:yes gene_type:complete